MAHAIRVSRPAAQSGDAHLQDAERADARPQQHVGACRQFVANAHRRGDRTADRDLLAAMSERARMQLRLQQTVEGLSVAAISYYVASLLHYVFESAAHYWPIEPTVATGISIPFVVIALTILLYRVKRGHERA